MHTLEIQHLSKTYKNGVAALKGVMLSIPQGIFGLLGPNGAGKSTLMRTLAALQDADSGTILFDGTDILKNPEYVRKRLGYLPQEFGVYPNISAEQLLNHLAVLKGINSKNERREQVAGLLNQTNLYPHRKQAVSTFSGGMRQRFGIAQALLGQPELIIVDEPTAGLDPVERNRFHNLLSEIGEKIIVILSTHIVEDVHNLCSEIAIMDDGLVHLQGNPTRLLDSLQGQIWQKTVTKKELEHYRQKMTVVSHRLNLGNTQLRIKADRSPGDGFEQVEPDLEDLYFSTLQRSETAIRQSS